MSDTYSTLAEGFEWPSLKHGYGAIDRNDFELGADSAFHHAAKKIDADLPTVEDVGHFLSEWLDDSAPLNEGRYVLVARELAKRYPAIGIIR